MISHLEREPKAPTRVVVLGASGFVGQDIIRHLNGLRIEVAGLSSKDVDLIQEESVEKLRSLMRKNDSLIIVSAITPDKGKDVGTLMRNLKMGQHLTHFLETADCSHVIYISSDAVYADDVNPAREASCCDPTSFHGLMHLVRERMLSSALQNSKTPYAILRPCAVYGDTDTHNSYGPNRFLRDVLKEHNIKLFGNGEEKRDHIYINDLSGVVALCLLHRTCGVLNVATGESISFFDLAKMIVQLTTPAVEIEGSQRMTPITHRHFDITAIYEAFPEFKFTSLEEGLLESFQNLKRAMKD